MSSAPLPCASTAQVRVLHVVSRSQRRGAELVAMELADELDRLGYENRLMALGPGFDGGREPGLVPLTRTRSERLPQLVGHVLQFRRVVARDPVDVVLAHGGWSAQVVALALPLRGPGGPLLVWQRILGFPDKIWNPVRRRWWGAVARRFDAVVALTDHLADEVRRLEFRGQIWLIPNSRQPDRFLAVDRSIASARLRSEVGVPVETSLIGYVGHLVRQKRPERAIGTLALLRAEGHRAHLVVAGDGPLRPSLDAHAECLRVGDAVTFLGHRSDVEWVLGGVDVALLTSDADAMPGVAIEALMAGCPMVTVPVGGVAEVVEPGVTGLVLDDDDPASMARAVAHLLSDSETRGAMSRACRLRTDRFTASSAAAVYAERLTAALATS